MVWEIVEGGGNIFFLEGIVVGRLRRDVGLLVVRVELVILWRFCKVLGLFWVRKGVVIFCRCKMELFLENVYDELLVVVGGKRDGFFFDLGI